MAIKLQINSVAALERLIGDDNETEMEIKEQVVLEFTKKHLKALVPGIVDKVMPDLSRLVKSTIEEVYFEKRQKSGWGGTELIPKETTEKLKLDEIKYKFESMIRDEVTKKADEALAKVFTPEYIDRIMQLHIQDQITIKARELVRAKLSGL